jgi:hypothetical protein
MKKSNTLKGVILATAAAGVFLAAGCATQGQSGATASAGGVKCSGVNACKGQGACKSTTNNCKGQSSCKGKGFVMMSSDAECKAAYEKMWNG